MNRIAAFHILPEWLLKPEAVFWTVLWLLSPLLSWFVGKGIRHVESWNAQRSSKVAKARLNCLYMTLAEEPPTLMESITYIVCFLPLPFAIASIALYIHFSPESPFGPSPLDPATAHKIGERLLAVIFLCTYLIYSGLFVHGIKVAYRLRHGEKRYKRNYMAGIQKQIDKLEKKFPQLKPRNRETP